MESHSEEIQEFGKNAAMERWIKIIVGAGEIGVGMVLVPLGIGTVMMGMASHNAHQLVEFGYLVGVGGFIGISVGAEDVAEAIDDWRDDWSD